MDRGWRVRAMQVSQALNTSDIPNDVTSITGLKMQRLSFDYVREHAQDFVDGRVRAVLVKRLQESEMHALQLQDDVGAIERVGVVCRCSRTEQVAGIWLRARASNSENEYANVLQLLRMVVARRLERERGGGGGRLR
jgi:hypothetical protein